MRNNHLKPVAMIIAALVVAVFPNASAQAAEVTLKMKEKGIREPHQVHLEIAKYIPSVSVKFSNKGIKDWKGFVGSLKSKLDSMPFSPGIKAMIKGFRPGFLNKADKAMVINELNKLLTNPDLSSNVKGVVKFSKATQKAEKLYKKKWTEDNLKWLNRSIMNDMFPQTPRIERVDDKKYAKMRNFICEACHEFLTTTRVKLDENYLKEHDKTKRYIIRTGTAGTPPLLEAVSPKNPYTFKPTLNRLVCVECHSPAQQVKKILRPDGKTWVVPVFYGEGPKRPKR